MNVIALCGMDRENGGRLYRLNVMNVLTWDHNDPIVDEETFLHLVDWIMEKEPDSYQEKDGSIVIKFAEDDDLHIDWLLSFSDYVINLK